MLRTPSARPTPSDPDLPAAPPPRPAGRTAGSPLPRASGAPLATGFGTGLCELFVPRRGPSGPTALLELRADPLRRLLLAPRTHARGPLLRELRRPRPERAHLDLRWPRAGDLAQPRPPFRPPLNGA